MKKIKCGLLLLIVVFVTFGGEHALAQYNINEADVYRKFASGDLVQSGSSIFGDKISLYAGAVEFDVVDVALNGNIDIPVEFRRRYRIEDRRESSSGNYPLGKGYLGGAGEWDIDVPYLRGVFLAQDRWHTSLSGAKSDLRCSNVSMPVNYGAISYPEYWDGNFIHVPGKVDDVLLAKESGSLFPQNASEYPWVTKSQWSFSCLPATKNGYLGEAFVGISPDGKKYYFDWVVERVAPYVNYNGIHWERNAVYFLASKVEDQFGNWVEYHYSGGQLDKVSSSDGRQIDIFYSQGKVSTVETGGRVWKYFYSSNNRLQTVVLPDDSFWAYSATGRLYIEPPLEDDYNPSSNCSHSGPSLARRGAFVFNVRSPSGSNTKYSFAVKKHGRKNVPRICAQVLGTSPPKADTYLRIPHTIYSYSLVKKEVTGPGIPAAIWTYQYPIVSGAFQSQCLASPCAESKQVRVTEPDGKIRSYDFGIQFGKNDGLLLAEHVGDDSQPYQVTKRSYYKSPGDPNLPFPMYAGLSYAPYSDEIATSAFQPAYLVQTIFGDDIYASVVNEFDRFVRPISVTKSNPWNTRTEVVEYYDDLSKWILGQVKKQITLNSAPNGQTTTASMVSSEVEYNAQALPWKTYKFGKLQQILSYWPDGSVNTVTDGRGNVTWLGDYSRGIPRLIGHPDGTTESASVDGNGWITAVTDEIGAKTCYGYDAMGRVSSITYPSETQLGVCDTSRWHQTTIATEFINTPEHGIAAGHWRTALRHGPNAHINTYYDAMLRPVLEEKLDLNNIAGTLSQVVKRYDTSGRLSFQSYPTTNVGDVSTVTQGVRTLYDALDRVTRVEQDSEFGTPLATTTEYLPGLKTRVTNPRGFQTTTEYMAWDQPSYDLPILSQQPEGKTIQIARHPQFGWPLSLTQRNAANTLSQTRRYVYDSHTLLCKTIEPETGATWFGYDAAGNLAASSAGLSLPDATNCNWSEGANSSRKVTRTYDQRNRLSTLNFPDGRGNQIWTYANDGLPASITTYNGLNNTNPVVNAYTYNNRRLLAGETTSQPGTYTWSLGYGYDAIGNLSNQTYPTGLNIDYAPNALGQPTKAGAYASGALYYPNGALKQFTYGNGIVHTMTQNARQLPQRVTSSGGALDYSYVYDANGNPEHIANELVAGYDPRDRWMGYDGLDRLTDAGSASFGGDHWHRYTYDALDNMKSWKLAGVKDYAEYVYDNATNRLISIRNTAGATVMGLDYDLQGNLRNKNGQLYDFDYGNRLREVTSKESYRYDGLGRRVQTTKTDGSKTTLWLYSQAGQMLFSSDWDGANYANQKTHENVYLAGSVIAIIDHDWPSNAVIATKYQHTDALGSPVAVTNASGAVIDRNDYEPYGAIIGKPTYSGIGYTGHVMDGATGLTYMQQRYYDQSIGRFLSVDTVTADGGDYRHFNRYTYAYNNPYQFTDPDGRAPPGCGDGSCPTFGEQFNHGVAVGSSDAIKGINVGRVGGSFGFRLGYLSGQVGINGLPNRAQMRRGALVPRVKAPAVTQQKPELPDDALVCRGGTCTAENFANGTGVTRNADGTLNGVSTQSRAGASVEELSRPFKNGRVGVTTAGQIRKAGGTVTPDGTPGNPNHATVNGLTEHQLEKLFTPTIPNPSRK